MELLEIYGCLCDRTRLRLLNLLLYGPLCVCHLQKVLGEPQVKVSEHLAWLKSHGLVEVKREANWRIYRLVAKPTPALKANLACLQDCATEERIFQRDTGKLKELRDNLGTEGARCSTKRHPRPGRSRGDRAGGAGKAGRRRELATARAVRSKELKPTPSHNV